MREIEILVQLNESISSARQKIVALAKRENVHQTKDVYFFDPARTELQPDSAGALRAAFRVRTRDGGDASIAYKVDHFDDDGRWTYSDEHETNVADAEACIRIAALLGLKELVTVISIKEVYRQGGYELVLEEVEGLGAFLEVERKAQDSTPADEAKRQVQAVLDSLGVAYTRPSDAGKPEQLLAKKGNF